MVDSLSRFAQAHPSPWVVLGRPSRPAVPTLFPAIGDLSDYTPPFAANGVTADADGNVWIREPDAGVTEGAVYDLVNRRGNLFSRVRLPGGTTVAGFGPGVVYLSSREGAGIGLARARIR